MKNLKFVDVFYGNITFEGSKYVVLGMLSRLSVYLDMLEI